MLLEILDYITNFLKIDLIIYVSFITLISWIKDNKYCSTFIFQKENAAPSKFNKLMTCVTPS
jgi:hypothetical protein